MSGVGQHARDTDLQGHHGGCVEARSPRCIIRCSELPLDGVQPAAQPVNAFLRARKTDVVATLLTLTKAAVRSCCA